MAGLHNHAGSHGMIGQRTRSRVSAVACRKSEWRHALRACMAMPVSTACSANGPGHESQRWRAASQRGGMHWEPA